MRNDEPKHHQRNPNHLDFVNPSLPDLPELRLLTDDQLKTLRATSLSAIAKSKTLLKHIDHEEAARKNTCRPGDTFVYRQVAYLICGFVDGVVLVKFPRKDASWSLTYKYAWTYKAWKDEKATTPFGK